MSGYLARSQVAGLSLLFWVALSLAPEAASANARDFHEAQADAYAHYREAAFYTRTGNITVAALALDEFIVKWSALVDRFAGSPPREYAGDEQWNAVLNEILERSRSGLEALDAGDAEAAAESINPVRDMLGELRRRNGVVTYSDHVDALTAAMDVMAGYRGEIRELDDPADVEKIGKQADVVEALFEKLEREAPPQVADDPEFKRMISGATESMERLRQGLKTGNARLFRIGAGELRSYERIMFLRYG